MKQVVRDGKTITVFDNVEELKWHYHRKLCKDSGDAVATIMVNVCGLNDVDEANRHLRDFGEPCEVKKH